MSDNYHVINLPERPKTDLQNIGDAYNQFLATKMALQKAKREQEQQGIENAYKQAQTAELARKTKSYDEQVGPQFLRQPGGNIVANPDYYSADKEREKAKIHSQEEANSFKEKLAMLSGSNPSGIVPVGANIGGINFANLPGMQAVEEQKAQAPTTQQKNDLNNIQNQSAMIDQMKQDAEKLPGGYSGIGASIESMFTRGASNPALKVYQDQRPAYAVSIYRALTGDTRLSDADAKARALPLLWSVTEDPSVRTMKFEKIQQALQNRKRLLASGKFNKTPEGDSITPLESVLSGESHQYSPEEIQAEKARRRGAR